MIDPAAHRAEVEAWREDRYEALRRDQGWLTLAGLAWLRLGANRVGSARDNDVVLPAGPRHAGTLTLSGDGVVAAGDFRHENAPADGLRIADDHEGASEPTLLELDGLRLIVIRRGDRLGVRTWDLDAPLRRDFTGIDHWPVDPAWRLAAAFEATPDRTLHVPDVLGPGYEEASPGDVVFRVGDRQHRLQAMPGGPGGELWLIFGDATNGIETYAGGRFLYTGPPDGEGGVVVDFNRAYNPPCVFSPYATCPLPWPANRLDVRIEAGEKTFRRP
ncbi:MAG: DUF1684 domain-containing protein [Chloroflexi bacterium]|nr:DUF1684 domain-containing protein [Chloroflexota bacterium]